MNEEGKSNAGFEMMSQLRNNAGEPSAFSKASRTKRKVMLNMQLLIARIKEVLDLPEGQNEPETLPGPTSVAAYNYFAPNAAMDTFLVEKLANMLELRDESLSI